MTGRRQHPGHRLYRALLRCAAAPRESSPIRSASTSEECSCRCLCRGGRSHQPGGGGRRSWGRRRLEACTGGTGRGDRRPAAAGAGPTTSCSTPPWSWKCASRVRTVRRQRGGAMARSPWSGMKRNPALPFWRRGRRWYSRMQRCSAGWAGGAPLAETFRAYERHRLARTARLTLAARRQGSLLPSWRPVGRLRDLVLRLLPGPLAIRRLDWLYGWHPPADVNAI